MANQKLQDGKYSIKNGKRSFKVSLVRTREKYLNSRTYMYIQAELESVPWTVDAWFLARRGIVEPSPLGFCAVEIFFLKKPLIIHFILVVEQQRV